MVKTELIESEVAILRLAVKEGLEEITKLESRLYPRPTETFHLRTCFYAVKAVLDAPKKEEPIPHIHPFGISDCVFCRPTLPENWKSTVHDHSSSISCVVPFCGFNSKTERLEQSIGENVKKYLDEKYPNRGKDEFPDDFSDYPNPSKLKEFYDNLIFVGFGRKGAMELVKIVAGK